MAAKKQEVIVPMGRPTKYDQSFHPQELVVLMGMGYHVAQVAKEFKIAKSTLYEWAENHPEFSDALKKGKTYLEAFFYEKFLTAAQMPSQMTNTAALIFLAKNTVGWSDKVEHQFNPEKITELVFE